MSKNIYLDKFYTPKHTVEKCLDIFFDLVDPIIISDIIEPSAGNGAFSLLLDNCKAFDISPEHPSIIKQDFLTLDISYKANRAIIGNPPFGNRNNLALKFFKKSITISDYIGFILPISQLNNKDSFYEFDLIGSESLGKIVYSGVSVHCCFNVYKRPPTLHKKPRLSSPLFTLHRTNRDNFDNTQADFIFCKRGSVGKEIFEGGKRFSDEYKVVVKDKKDLEFVRDTILNHDWKNFKTHQSSPNISKNDIYRLFIN